MTDTYMGLGVLFPEMFSDSWGSVAAFQGAVGKEITALTLGEDDALHFTFTDGSRIKLYDQGQSCCESRYMRTDDDLSYYVGSQLLDATVQDAPNVEEEYEMHEVQFLHVKTSRGTFTMSTHNEHNGYYGGFYLVAAVED